MKKYSKILILALMGFTGTVAIAADSIPIEATAAAEAQQVALEYGNEKDQKSESSGDKRKPLIKGLLITSSLAYNHSSMTTQIAFDPSDFLQVLYPLKAQ